MSLFNRHTCENRARAIPRLTARAKESGASEISTRSCGQAVCSHSAVPSSEPLSTTMISEGKRSRSRRMPASCAASSSFPFRDGITTEMPAAVSSMGHGAAVSRRGRNVPAILAAWYQNVALFSGLNWFPVSRV
jgi:hypothetical protein